MLDDLTHDVRHFHELTTHLRHCDVENELEAAATAPLVPSAAAPQREGVGRAASTSPSSSNLKCTVLAALGEGVFWPMALFISSLSSPQAPAIRCGAEVEELRLGRRNCRPERGRVVHLAFLSLALAVLWPSGAVWCVASARAMGDGHPWRRRSRPAIWQLLRREHQPWRRPLVFPCWGTLEKATLEWKRLVVVVVVVVRTGCINDVFVDIIKRVHQIMEPAD